MIFQVHGLLHLLGFDHEISDDAEKEMEEEEELILKNLGWRGKGLIKSANDGHTDEVPKIVSPNGKFWVNFFLIFPWFIQYFIFSCHPLKIFGKIHKRIVS